MSIRENLLAIKSSLPGNVTLIAISKTKPVADLLEAYNAGQRDFGENKIQEMVEKWEQLPTDVRWHMVGHVQTNKVRQMAAFVHLIHGVDSFRLLQEINKQAKKHNRVIDCLLQLHIAEEETKFGFDKRELEVMLNSTEFEQLANIRVCGLMGMATFTDDKQQIEKEFISLKAQFDSLKNRPQTSNVTLQVLSMGMSGDFNIAIRCGSTMVRIGSSIFGQRN